MSTTNPHGALALLRELEPLAITADGAAALAARVLAHAPLMSAPHAPEQIDGLLQAAARARSAAAIASGVAVIPLRGVIAPRADGFLSLFFGLTGLDQFIAAVESAINDPTVGAVVLGVHSPGGSVQGVPDAAARLHGLRGSKPIVAAVDHEAGSAAYWIASAADEITISKAGRAGSIGVFAQHVSEAQALENEGYRVTLVSSTPEKVELSPALSLTDAARAAVQADVDYLADLFIEDVARHRGVSRKAAAENFGRGRMLRAEAAVSAGLADRIETITDTVARVSARAARRAAQAQAAAGEIERLRLACELLTI